MLKDGFKEEFVILLSVFRWVILATIVGIIVGMATTLFLRLLNLSAVTAGKFSYYYLALPAALFISEFTIKYLAPDAEGHGTEKVIEAIHKSSGKIKTVVIPVKAAATLVTIAAGGSVGKEGPCAQIGGGLSSLLADILKFDNEDRKKLVICGISAGFSSVFGTPVAGAILGVEVLFIGAMLYDVLLPSFVAGITSYQISSHFGVTYFYYPVSFTPVFNEIFFIKIIIAGIFFGICSFIFIETLKLGGYISKKVGKLGLLKPVIAGAALIVLTLIFSKQYLGLGLDTIHGSLSGVEIIWYAFIIKMIFTSITLNFGGSGGIVTPIFFVGATSGAVIAPMLNLDQATCSSIGIVALLAGTANTPIAASIMAIEMFGREIAPYAAIACVISFLITGHRSVYPSQIIGIRKSRYIVIETGKEVESAEAKIDMTGNGFIAINLRIARFLRNLLIKLRTR